MMNEEQLASYTPQPPVKNRRGLKPFLVAFFVLVILGGLGAAGYYMYQRNQSLKSDVAARDAKISSLNKQVSNLSSQNNTSGASTQSDGTFKVRELGISLKLPDSLSDVTYSYNGQAASDVASEDTFSASFSTKALTDLDAACSSFSAAPPLGMLSKVSGQYPKTTSDADGATVPPLVKQFDDFYIAYTAPQSTCSDKVDATNVASLLADFKKAMTSVKETK